MDHVHVTTPRELEAETVAFYETCLGLTRLDKPPGVRGGGAWFVAGGQQVHVGLDERNPHRTAHFGLVVDNWEAVLERLREAGVHVEQAVPVPGRRRFFTRDPAGNRIEVAAFDEQAG